MLFCTSFSLIWAHSLGSIQLSGNLWTCHRDMIYNIYNIRYKQYILSPWFHKINQINLTVYYGNLSIVTGLTNHITFFYVKSFVKICISVDRFVFFASFSVFFFCFFFVWLRWYEKFWNCHSISLPTYLAPQFQRLSKHGDFKKQLDIFLVNVMS